MTDKMKCRLAGVAGGIFGLVWALGWIALCGLKWSGKI